MRIIFKNVRSIDEIPEDRVPIAIFVSGYEDNIGEIRSGYHTIGQHKWVELSKSGRVFLIPGLDITHWAYIKDAIILQDTDVEKQEEIVSILTRLIIQQKCKEPTFTHSESQVGIHAPTLGEALEKIMDLFGYKVVPID